MQQSFLNLTRAKYAILHVAVGSFGFSTSQFAVHFKKSPSSFVHSTAELPLLRPSHLYFSLLFLHTQAYTPACQCPFTNKCVWHLNAQVQYPMCVTAYVHSWLYRRIDVIVTPGDAYYLPVWACGLANWEAASVERSGPSSGRSPGFWFITRFGVSEVQ